MLPPHVIRSSIDRRQLIRVTAALAVTRTHLIQAAASAESTASSSNAAAAGTLTLGGDLRVNRLGFGAMRITGPGIWGDPSDVQQAKQLLRRALELQINFIDTADSYGPEVSERLICEALHPYPQGLVIATKGGLTRSGPNDWSRDARPQHLRTACEASLKRLRLQRIDVYQLHAPDPNVPISESLGELARLQREGKIRHIGVSNFKLSQLKEAQRIVKVVSVQNRYNPGDRSYDDVIDYCTQQGIAFLPWGPLGNHERLTRIAAKHGVSATQATLAWLLARSPIMLPIPGTSSRTHLEENVAAAAVRLSADDLAEINT